MARSRGPVDTQGLNVAVRGRRFHIMIPTLATAGPRLQPAVGATRCAPSQEAGSTPNPHRRDCKAQSRSSTNYSQGQQIHRVCGLVRVGTLRIRSQQQ